MFCNVYHCLNPSKDRLSQNGSRLPSGQASARVDPFSRGIYIIMINSRSRSSSSSCCSSSSSSSGSSGGSSSRKAGR